LRRPVIVFGAMRGKRVREVLRALAPLAPRFVFTRVGDPGAIAPHALLRAWRHVTPTPAAAAVASDPGLALERASAMRRDDAPIVVAGSLYLVGAIRGMIVGE
jgi:dihydrofolate synthase/folylpolyglutamate synthase